MIIFGCFFAIAVAIGLVHLIDSLDEDIGCILNYPTVVINKTIINKKIFLGGEFIRYRIHYLGHTPSTNRVCEQIIFVTKDRYEEEQKQWATQNN